MERDTNTRKAIEELKNYNCIKAAVENLNDEIKMIEASMRATGGILSPIPIHGGGCKQEEKLINSIDKKSNLLIKVNEKKTLIEIIDRSLSVLNHRERRAVEVAYIQDCESAVDVLCEEFNVEEITVHRIKRRALEKYINARFSG